MIGSATLPLSFPDATRRATRRTPPSILHLCSCCTLFLSLRADVVFLAPPWGGPGYQVCEGGGGGGVEGEGAHFIGILPIYQGGWNGLAWGKLGKLAYFGTLACCGYHSIPCLSFFRCTAQLQKVEVFDIETMITAPTDGVSLLRMACSVTPNVM